MTILIQIGNAFAPVLCRLILYSFPWRTGYLRYRKLTVLVFQRRLIQHHPFNANCQGKTKDVTYHCHQDVWILSLNSYASNWPLFFCTYLQRALNVIVSVIFWPGLQAPIKFPFLQNNCGPVNHHHSLPLLLPARFWLPGPQQTQYHWFPLMAAAVMMTSRKHWNWQKMLK